MKVTESQFTRLSTIGKESVIMSKAKFTVRSSRNHLTWTLNYLYTKASKKQTIWIIDNYYHLAKQIDQNFKANWEISYRADVIKETGNPVYTRDVVLLPFTLSGLQVGNIKFSEYLVMINFEFSLDHNESFMMSTNADNRLPYDRLSSENEVLKNIGKLLDIKLKCLGLYTSTPIAATRSSQIYYQTHYHDESKSPNGSLHTPLGININIYKRDYLENESASIFVPPDYAIHYDADKQRSFTYDMVFPSKLIDDNDFISDLDEELFSHGM